MKIQLKKQIKYSLVLFYIVDRELFFSSIFINDNNLACTHYLNIY